MLAVVKCTKVVGEELFKSSVRLLRALARSLRKLKRKLRHLEAFFDSDALQTFGSNSIRR